jgi:predicted flavoprotein YhiN
MRHVVVIGAGAAGMTAAIRAGEAGAQVTLLNAHPKVGLKILMSGGTRCNVTHAKVDERDFHGGSRNVIARILRSFTATQAMAWFTDDLAVPLKLEDTGKYFPESDDAQTVLDALLAAAQRAGVVLRSGARVIQIEREVEGAWQVGVQRMSDSASFGAAVHAFGGTEWELPERAPDEWIAADAIILATGGLSFPRTGSDGTGYALATSVGHTIVAPVPALTPLGAADTLCEAAQGVTLDVELSFWRDAKREATARGSFLIAHFGYSGPAALDLSRHWNRAVADGATSGLRVTANFAPGKTREKLQEEWFAATARGPKLSVRGHLGEWLPLRLASELAWEAEIDPVRPLAQVSKVRRDALLTILTERDMHVNATLGYEKAEVTAGGVPLEEVDSSTLESRRAKGLWLCGEVLDVEGRLGGFNFQWAWSSGTVAGRAAAR